MICLSGPPNAKWQTPVTGAVIAPAQAEYS
mgnify:CR=1 FL=1